MTFFRRNSQKNSQSPNIRPSTSAQCKQAIHEAAYPEIWPPFNGNILGPVVVRPLRQAEIEACGHFSLIETFYDKISNQKINPHDMLAYLKIQHRILKAALVSPTYDEVLQVAGAYDNLESCRERIDAFRKEVAAENNQVEKNKKKTELLDLELLYYQVLPADFTGHILAFVLKIAESDIKKVDEEMLMNAAALARNNRNRPSDNVSGSFTDFHKADFDRRAWALWITEQEKNRHAGRRGNR